MSKGSLVKILGRGELTSAKVDREGPRLLEVGRGSYHRVPGVLSTVLPKPFGVTPVRTASFNQHLPTDDLWRAPAGATLRSLDRMLPGPARRDHGLERESRMLQRVLNMFRVDDLRNKIAVHPDDASRSTASVRVRAGAG